MDPPTDRDCYLMDPPNEERDLVAAATTTARPSISSNSRSNNTCVICLEPLLKVDDDADDQVMCDVGATSCGHPVHCSCFESWADFHRKSNTDKGVPCPTCQQETKSFVRIYLCAETCQPTMSEEDDAEEEDQEQDQEDRIATPRRTPPASKQLPHKKKPHSYKKRWMNKVEECKLLKLEAKNRQKCHHEDLVDLERAQLLNFRLVKQLQKTVRAAAFRRNAVGLVCFGVGWLCSWKLRF